MSLTGLPRLIYSSSLHLSKKGLSNDIAPSIDLVLN